MANLVALCHACLQLQCFFGQAAAFPPLPLSP